MNPSNSSDLRKVAKFLKDLADMMDSSSSDDGMDSDDSVENDVSESKLTSSKEIKVGFWTKDGKEITVDRNWREKNLSAYTYVVRYLETPSGIRHLKGLSTCRLCHRDNGGKEFHKDNFVYPEGYLHYITAHCVVPDERIILKAMRARK